MVKMIYWMMFDASKTSFVNQIWNPYCVGAPDSIIGWTVTAADNTISNILHANNSGPAYWIIVDQYAFGPGPYTFQSPDYEAASANDVHIEISGHNWNFGANGNLTFPDSTTQNTAYTGSTYGDSNVAAYLSTNVPTGTYSNSNVTAYLSSSTATVANLVISGSAPSSLTGSAGDTAGMIRADSNYIYYCTADWTSSSYTVGWEGASGNTIFLTKGSYPTPQVGWAVSNTSGYGPWTINTITDNGTNWRITFVGTPYGEAGGGTATLTNPTQPTIWKTIPITAFGTPSTTITNGANSWNFTSGGALNLPSTALIAGGPYGSAQLDLSLGAGITALRQMSGPTGGVFINTSPTDTVAHTWTFDYGGNLVYPDGSKQTTAYTGPTYSNANVASYLTTQTFYSNANVASYLVANPQAGTYSNTNVSSYLSSGVTTGNLTTTGNVVQQGSYYEKYGNVSNTGGNLTCNFNNGGIFYATLSANVTANFTNVNAIASTVTGATIVVDQGATAYRVANVQVNGVNQTVKWVGATAGAGTASNTDVMSFSLINLGGGAYRVLGQISNYG